ncbi:hypothetical protein L0U85_07585 [Glycomyces sp. L485]|uniref:hypothetical protein n=1 Tax=Glycomyces sp. L485 TaxID=2909235 RepID=UPI001F4A5D17|nr:hypothetical protein [Glycomyces sp. L485]MCH7230711.1 hypothetical protein [Glycomyces sp. L485]
MQGVAHAYRLSCAMRRLAESHRTTPEQGYYPLDRASLNGAHAVLHVSAGTGTEHALGDAEANGEPPGKYQL